MYNHFNNILAYVHKAEEDNILAFDTIIIEEDNQKAEVAYKDQVDHNMALAELHMVMLWLVTLLVEQ